MFKELYLKTIKLAGHKNSKFFLGFFSFIESFIFPIPPDVAIIPMTIAKKQDWIKIALIATICSVLGACFGYFIGYVFFNEIGIRIFEFIIPKIRKVNERSIDQNLISPSLMIGHNPTIKNTIKKRIPKLLTDDCFFINLDPFEVSCLLF